MPHFELNADVVAELDRPVVGVGGFQTFLRRLQEQLNHATREIKLSDDDLTNIAHYAFDYQQGGWQERLLLVFGRVLGPRLGREDEASEA
jgi:hypothetical protein